MARMGKNSLMYGVTGMFAKQIVYKKRRGKRYVAGPPNVKENRVPGKAEQAVRDRFKQSNDYASSVVKDPKLKAQYEAVAKKRQTANNVAFSDAYHPPVISGILAYGYAGVTGNIITIQARDNFKVASVMVAIYDENDIIIEQGNAVDNGDKLNWMYTVTKNGRGSKIIVKAYDLPWNETTKEFVV